MLSCWGAGCDLDGSGWVSSGEEFFLEEERLADAYRDIYVKELRKLYDKEQQLALVWQVVVTCKIRKASFSEFCDALGRKRRWVIHTGSPEHCKHPGLCAQVLVALRGGCRD